MLKLINIKKTFNAGTPNEKKVFDNLNLTVKKGEFVTIIGSNGAGKSTLFSVIAGDYMVDSGTILLEGKDSTYIPEYKRSAFIGRLFQDPLKGTAPSMTIEENLALAYLRSGSKRGAFSNINKNDREYFIAQLKLLDLGLENRLSHPVGFLSGGQRQALTLLMATLVPPKLLLLDEYTSALDPAIAEKVLSITQDIIDKHGITCMMITHNLATSLEVGSRTIMMDNGNIVLNLEKEERANMSVADLLNAFKHKTNTAFDNDRSLLQK